MRAIETDDETQPEVVDTEVGAAAVEDDESAGHPAPSSDRRSRVWRSLVHPGRGQVIAAVMLFVVGMAGVMQIRVNHADDTYANARREDLIQLLDGLGQESRRLESEIADLEKTRTNLVSGADTERVARQEAQRRIEVLSILAGTMPAEGPGIKMTITDPQGKVTADNLLDAVEEMRDAGAEVIEFNNSVRVVASTWFGSDSKGLIVDGQHLSGPIVMEVIGDPHGLEEGARFRGGIVSEITGPKIGGEVEISQAKKITIQSLHTPSKNQYAQPASPPPTPR
ncbi:hypothetical protein GCM10009841_22220 [Microlunatus panaciterrae]